ncbi:tyrosine-type recombinase/integrase [Pseudonocardia aurantiaca]|uniref:Tyrosine-type recombinase/integrase n=1 Tax=Pseudonocardia aurantiaca TaxID=75290 RepID=A0ABW4FYP9_9PSEU
MAAVELQRVQARAAALGLTLPPDAFLFSGSPGSFLTPDSVTQRYDRMVTRLGIGTTLHKLRHYSATELIAGGVDPRTVAGRLGHGGGGTTTLKTYTAWVAEADQRAAKGLGAGMPRRPAEMDPAERIRSKPRYPYEIVASALARQIAEGALPVGSDVPSAADLADKHDVSLATANRSLALVRDWGLLERDGRYRLRVADLADVQQDAEAPAAGSVTARLSDSEGDILLDLTIRHCGGVVARFSSVVDPRNAGELQQVLTDAVLRRGGDIGALNEYEMDVHRADETEPMVTFVASRRTA